MQEMISVAKSVGATLANQALTLVVQSDNGILTDIYSASIQIIKASDGSDALAKTALNVADAPTGTRIGTGRYAYVWTTVAIGAAAVGQYTVRWYYTLASGGTEQSFDQELEIVPKPYVGQNSCTLYDLRDEGLTTDIADDAKAQKWIARASRFVEMYTGRRFYPQYKMIQVDGRESRAVSLDEPIIAMDTIGVDYFTIFGANAVVIPGETLKVYNRHLTQNLLSPDDRDNPKLEFVHGNDLGGVNFSESQNSGFQLTQLIFPRGTKNVQLTGIFGYTDYDGSFVGCTPFMIREATKMLVFRMQAQMADVEAREEARNRGRLIEEHTRDQGVQYAAPWNQGGLTGDFAIDSILLQYMRPPQFGAA